MMKTNSSKDILYLGKGIGRELLKEIKSAKKSIQIVSPYLSPSYVDELISLRAKGVKITLITSDEIKEGDGYYSDLEHTDLIKQKRTTDISAKKRREKGMKYSALGFLAPILFFLIFSSSIAWRISIAEVIITFFVFIHYYMIAIYSYSYFSIFRLKVFHSQYNKLGLEGEDLIHSKVYVIDERVAYLGSANFTHEGFNDNYESLVKVEDKTAVQNISDEVEALYRCEDRFSMPIDVWGKSLYEEPKH